MSLTPLQLSALAILHEGPSHPYEVYQLMLQRREDRVVKVRPGTLYHAIGRLADDGLLQSCGTDRCGNRPERTTYRITDAGRAALRATVDEWVSRPVYEYPRFPCAVAELHELPAEHALDLLTTRAERLESEHTLLVDTLAYVGARGLPERFILDVDYQASMLLAEVRWLRATAARIADGTMDWDSPAPPADPGTLPERPLSLSPYYDPARYGPPDPPYAPPARATTPTTPDETAGTDETVTTYVATTPTTTYAATTPTTAYAAYATASPADTEEQP
ncbi:PadR family transcriptional regulator [Raineyella sp. LH-20]|uniref:PadR family transcriptional regulator n=1 Tax=Raineyella sp. LH-20 TaxID=3081204 RepID=UPI0029558BDF|nr:PadR family transcriptional regulator [Raineyella sp. LH-20]WOP19473.1 PadR family transcriptional regulator [Raineyella sp. LH-20]